MLWNVTPSGLLDAIFGIDNVYGVAYTFQNIAGTKVAYDNLSVCESSLTTLFEAQRFHIVQYLAMRGIGGSRDVWLTEYGVYAAMSEPCEANEFVCRLRKNVIMEQQALKKSKDRVAGHKIIHLIHHVFLCVEIILILNASYSRSTQFEGIFKGYPHVQFLC